MDFGGFDDDFFEDSSKKKENKEIDDWKPHQAEPGWFIESCSSAHYGNDSFNLKQFRANYLYFIGNYSESVKHFEELKSIANTSHQQREVYEGYVRSLLRDQQLDKAIEALEDFRSCCKNREHVASYNHLSAEIYHVTGDHNKELEHLKKLVESHPLNCDFWHRIARCYASLSQKRIDNIPFKLAEHQDFTWNSAASLIRADLILRIGAGRDRCGMHKKKRNRILLDKFGPIIASLPHNFVSKCHEMMGKDVQNYEMQQEETEFVDLGSSSRAKTVEASETEETEDENDFDRKWFSFFESIVL